jgi:O-methyltransferase involved in polyketide biosynthesis
VIEALDKKAERSFEKISPTAWSVAWRRTFTDIPYSKEVFEQFKQMHAIGNNDSLDVMRGSDMAPLFEARYKLSNKLLRQSGISQVLELAAGLTPRGLELTRDPAITYAELDLPNMVREKKRILEGILGKETRPNLYLMEGNALSRTDVMRVTNFFRTGESVAVVNEGLLRYLTHEEKALVASNVLSILKECGGIWITPDTAIAATFEQVAGRSEEAQKLSAEVEKMTGINKERNYFKDEATAQAFFEDRGFSVEKHSYLEVFDQLSSPQILRFPASTAQRLIEHSTAFLMKAR